MTSTQATASKARPATDADVREVETPAQARQLVALLADIWGHPQGQPPMPPELVWSLVHAGNYAALAWRSGVAVGGSIGFRGEDGSGPILHSHMTGVVRSARGTSVGLALKLHQRTWALRHGIGRIVWTFDPLVARNAAFNIVKLGASLAEYHTDFYGPLTDSINVGDESDRCLVTWDVRAPRPVVPEVDAPLAVLVRAVDGGPDGLVTSYGDATWLRLEIPPDIVTLRRQQPEQSQSWRRAVRAALPAALQAGFTVTGFTRDSAYLLHRDPARSQRPMPP